MVFLSVAGFSCPCSALRRGHRTPRLSYNDKRATTTLLASYGHARARMSADEDRYRDTREQGKGTRTYICIRTYTYPLREAMKSIQDVAALSPRGTIARKCAPRGRGHRNWTRLVVCLLLSLFVQGAADRSVLRTGREAEYFTVSSLIIRSAHFPRPRADGSRRRFTDWFSNCPRVFP